MNVVSKRRPTEDVVTNPASEDGRLWHFGLDGDKPHVHPTWSEFDETFEPEKRQWVDLEPGQGDAWVDRVASLLLRLGLQMEHGANPLVPRLGHREFGRVTFRDGGLTQLDLTVYDEAAPNGESTVWLVMDDRSVVTCRGERVAGGQLSELADGGRRGVPTWAVALGLLEGVLHRQHRRLQAIQETLAGLDPLDHRGASGRALLDAVGRVRRELLQLYRRAYALHLVATRLEMCQRGEWPSEESQAERDALREQTTSLLERIEATRADAAFAAEMHVAMGDFDSNEAMKWLTIVSTAALPLVLVTAYYGMNFGSVLMPELESARWLHNMQFGGALWFLTVVGGAFLRSRLGSWSPARWRRRRRRGGDAPR